MPAYVILDVSVKDPAEYAAYRERSPATLEAYGGRYHVRGNPHEVVEGDWDPDRVVVLEFPSVERAREWYESDRKSTRLNSSHDHLVCRLLLEKKNNINSH